jgi:cytochrome c6
MHILTAVRWGAVVVFGIALFGGCKKETPKTTEAPQTAPAPAAPPPPIEQVKSGEALFGQHCAACHPNGGNISKPELSLHSNAMAAHKITKPEDIVNVMRNPGPGMNKFDAATIPDKDATAIAQYIMDTFK